MKVLFIVGGTPHYYNLRFGPGFSAPINPTNGEDGLVEYATAVASSLSEEARQGSKIASK